MAQLGQFNLLRILRHAPPGIYLEGGAHGEILLPARYVLSTHQVGDQIEVFVYRDSEDRLVATTERPLALVGQCASLRVVSIKPNVGAFLDWGLAKDLLLPLREQTRNLRAGDRVLVHLALDPRSDRIIATARLKNWLDREPPPFTEGQPVHLLIECGTPLGYRAIIEHTHHGLLYQSDVGDQLRVGQKLTGFIRGIRPDGKIDLSLDAVGYQRIAPLTTQILTKLRAAGGRLPFHDKSSPDDIRATFGVSKKAFKQALGALFKERQIVLDPDGIQLPRE